MTYELLIQHQGTIMLPPVVENVSIEWERQGQPGKLTAEVVKTPGLSFQEGDPCRFSVDGTPVFYGFVFEKSRKGSTDDVIQITVYDQLYYVTSTSPLEITVDQKKILSEAQLILTDAVRDYTVEMTTMPEFHETEEISGGAGDAAFASHKHRYQGRKKWKVHNALQMGEKVILLRCDGGQQYIVLGRWEARS